MSPRPDPSSRNRSPTAPPLSLLLIGLSVAPVSAQTAWPAWRGADRAATVDKAVAAPAAGGRPLWSVEVGEGQSSPVTIEGKDGGRVYVHSRREERETIQALSLRTGELVWRTAFDEAYEPYVGAAAHGRGAKSTPAISDGRLCTLSVTGYVTCLRASDGHLLWRDGFRERFSKTYPPFGASSSPLFVDGMLVVHVGGHPRGALLALDPETGRQRWSYEGEGPGYSSPIAVELHGRLQVVTQAHQNIVSVDARSGELLWRYPSITPCDQNVPTPLRVGERLVFSSYDSGVFALGARPIADGWTVEKAWHNDAVALYMSSAVSLGEEIVGFSHKKRGHLFALDAATGELIWSSGGALGEHASLLAQDERVLAFLTGGELLVVSAEGSPRLSEPTPVAQEALWAHPVPTSLGWLLRYGDRLTLLGMGGGSDGPAR